MQVLGDLPSVFALANEFEDFKFAVAELLNRGSDLGRFDLR